MWLFYFLINGKIKQNIWIDQNFLWAILETISFPRIITPFWCRKKNQLTLLAIIWENTVSVLPSSETRILKWRVYIKLKVSWLRVILWCMSQTSCDRVNSGHVRTHEKNSGETVHWLGTIIQSIFRAQSGASIRLTVWKWSGESRYPGSFPPVLENFRRAFSPGPTDHPWVSEDSVLLACSKNQL